MFRKNLYKFLYFLSGAAFILALPVLFTNHDNKAQGEVLGVYTDQASYQQPNADVSLIGPIVVGPVLSPEEAAKLPPFKFTDNAEPNFNAKAVLVYDLSSGEEIMSLNPNMRLPIASLTKLMTAIVAMEDPNFNNPINIKPEDRIQILPILGLKEADEIKPIDLVKAMLVGSANDAAWTLANHFPNQKDFINKMNAKARSLGMLNTSYSNPVGFDDLNNYSTVSDLKKLTEYALTKLPYAQVWQALNYTFKSGYGTEYYIKNTNDLVFSYSNIKSIKTGLTPGALQNMISEIQNAQGKKIVVMVLGAQDRNLETLRAMDYIFSNFAWR